MNYQHFFNYLIKFLLFYLNYPKEGIFLQIVLPTSQFYQSQQIYFYKDKQNPQIQNSILKIMKKSSINPENEKVAFYEPINFIAGERNTQELIMKLIQILQGGAKREMQKPLCLICSRNDGEFKVLLNSVLKRLKKISNEYIPDYRQLAESSSKNIQGFGRLLSVAMGSRSTSHQSFYNCQHDKFSRYLRRKLKCDNKTLNDLCNELVEKMAERNYHFEVINLQLRNLAKSCLKLSLSEEAKILAAQDLQRKAESLPTINTINMVMNQEMLQGQAYGQIAINTLTNSMASMPVYFLSIANGQAIVERRMFIEDEEEKMN